MYRPIARNQNWKDSDDSLTAAAGHVLQYPVAFLEVQALVLESLTVMSEFERVTGPLVSGPLADPLRAFTERWPATLARFWSENHQSYVPALDLNGRPADQVTSIPGYLLWAGAIPQAEAQTIADRLLAEDLATPYGIRTLGTAEGSFDPLSYHNGSVWPVDNWIIWRGLRRYGLKDAAQTVRDRLIEGLQNLGSVPELYVVRPGGIPEPHPIACKLQAWSAGAVLDMEPGRPD